MEKLPGFILPGLSQKKFLSDKNMPPSTYVDGGMFWKELISSVSEG